ncbi:FANTASTIC FOUR 3 [Spatholobus suberectus]|nr:FANTASTIC FOUR 3 [Spatholobus suberectus]
MDQINHTNPTQNNELLGSHNLNQTPRASETPTTTVPHKNSDSFSSLSSESLHLCTEGLGFESSDDVEDSKNGVKWESEGEREGGNFKKRLGLEEDCCDGEWRARSSRVHSGVEYPPPISCIGRSGKPWVSFVSYRDSGRFVLKQIRTPIQEFLRADREDGRLKFHFVQTEDEEFLEEEKEGDDDGGEEEDYDEVESVDEGEEHVGKENDQ